MEMKIENRKQRIEMEIENESGRGNPNNVGKAYKANGKQEKQKLASAKWTGIYKLNQNNEQRLTTVTDSVV